MRKPELIAAVAHAADLSTADATAAVEAILSEITHALAEDNSKVSLVGFGSFEKRHRAARKGKNPKTGEEIDIAASNSVGFKAGKAFKDALNQS